MLGDLVNWLLCKHKYQIIYKVRQVWDNGEFAGIRITCNVKSVVN